MTTISPDSKRTYKQHYVATLLEKNKRRRAKAARAARPDQLAEHEQPLDLLTWALYHRRQLKAEVAFDLTKHLYLVDIYNETAQQVVFMKAGQMGLSEYLVSYAMHACDQRRATVLYVFPTDTHVSDFSSARIGTAIEASDYLKSLIVEGGAVGNRSGADRITLKRIRDRFLYLRGSKVDPDGNAPQLRAIDADALVLDEYDAMDSRAPAIARKRLGHSTIAEERSASTPTYTGRGIHAEYLKSDQRKWTIRCGHCGEWQTITINHVVVEWDELERPVVWHGQKDGRAFVACQKCQKPLDRLASGQWVAQQPGRSIAGYHITKFASPVLDLDSLVEALQKTDETDRRETYNQDLGEPYTPVGGQMTDEILDACRRDYGHGPRRGQVCWMGVDVGSVLHVTVRGIDLETGERPQLWAGLVDSWDELGRTILRFQPRAVVIDALPETTKAREIQADFEQGRIWLAYYPPSEIGSKHTDPDQWNWDEGVVNLDRTRTLDAMFGDVLAEVATLPANARDIPDYYDHMKVPVRVLTKGRQGVEVARYVGSNADHYAHSENYCRVAMGAPREERVNDESVRVQVGY